MTIEPIQLAPNEEPDVEQAWEDMREHFAVWEARARAAKTYTYQILFHGPTVEDSFMLAELPTPVVIRRRTRDDLVEQIGRFEAMYGFATDELPARLNDGEIIESLDVRRWLSLKAIHDRLNQ